MIGREAVRSSLTRGELDTLGTPRNPSRLALILPASKIDREGSSRPAVISDRRPTPGLLLFSGSGGKRGCPRPKVNVKFRFSVVLLREFERPLRGSARAAPLIASPTPARVVKLWPAANCDSTGRRARFARRASKYRRSRERKRIVTGNRVHCPARIHASGRVGDRVEYRRFDQV